MQVAPSLHRLGNGLINSYLVEESGQVTIIDAGVPGYWGDIPAELAAMGRSIEDVRAIVLTHGHSDHIGFAERMRREHHTPVQVHELDAALARGEVPNPAKGLGPTRIGPLIRFMVYGGLRGGLRNRPLGEVVTFGDGATLDVPGSPRVILTPGHTRARRVRGSRPLPRTPTRLCGHSRGSRTWRLACCCRVTARRGPVASRKP
jgi:glyoxylase-like metal-dependent hydrolase (beta-lactamase superfamily II)